MVLPHPDQISLDNDIAHLIDRTQCINWEEDSPDLPSSLLAAEEGAKSVLVGKIIFHRILNKQALKEIVQLSWKTYEGLLIEYLGSNAFIFTFPVQETRDRIFQGGLWSFVVFSLFFNLEILACLLVKLNSTIPQYGFKSMVFLLSV
ncbi:hypothetical protein CJ030_MR7G027601 [Morella rubra]|uniref:DUF4283 domain-containing protein n=1 Tax=Morella rubra TaxID=262757 RepID=A0A6A1V1E3_9ROSI|nr:hypothetical protein CJ030_MR7G027601 [Morella rubra]